MNENYKSKMRWDKNKLFLRMLVDVKGNTYLLAAFLLRGCDMIQHTKIEATIFITIAERVQIEREREKEI